MNYRNITRSLIGLGMLSLLSTVGAQTHVTHELSPSHAQQEKMPTPVLSSA